MSGRLLALCGGIGGAKLALGLYHTLDPGQLIVAVNTGDDFEHLGLSISPDIDTVLYTLGGVADPERGWGRADESWHFMAALRELGGEDWFQLGDRDLAIHVERTSFLGQGHTLASFVAHVAQRLEIAATILPMTNDRVRTIVETALGDLPFQRYFVELRSAPAVRGLRFEGAARGTARRRLLRGDLASGAPRHRDLPIESLSQHRPDPRRAWRARGAGARHSAGDRRLSDHRRPGGQGSDGEDHGGARH